MISGQCSCAEILWSEIRYFAFQNKSDFLLNQLFRNICAGMTHSDNEMAGKALTQH